MDVHVLDINDRRDSARIVFHFDTPPGTNAAGIAFSAAYKQWREFDGATLQSVIPNLAATDPTHDAAIKNGTAIEHVESVEFSANATNGQKLAVISARWTELNSVTTTRITENLKFWGHAVDV